MLETSVVPIGAAHGAAKLAHGPEHFAAVVAALGVPAPSAMATITIGIAWSIDRRRASRRRERSRELAAAGANRGGPHAAEPEHEAARTGPAEVVVR